MTRIDVAPPRSHGCFWGCLVIIAFLFLPVLLAGGYGAWFLWQGFHHNPVLRTVSELINHDGLAHRLLGDDIRVVGMEGNAFSYIPGLGSHSDYEVRLSGSKASGRLDVGADTHGGRVTVTSMILTASDGSRYDLLHDRILTPDGGATSI
ncbi:MAG TPA: cytochrome c oxidase assembly factor Coa1 family protein [Rhizomicrobium sp.]|nr:cytochrome c oxidase assembly factor Coa1 family protein [Rhizomicrobium sp.]